MNERVLSGPAVTSALAVWETARALGRINEQSVGEALQVIEQYLTGASIQLVPLGLREAREAVQAHDRFGKGRHPAALNMGDCFAYACARTRGAKLLYKGDDFAQTDIEPA